MLEGRSFRVSGSWTALVLRLEVRAAKGRELEYQGMSEEGRLADWLGQMEKQRDP
jgi:hypothetical protein